MRFDEYRRHDATALAGLIAKGEVSAKEVLETAIARAEQVNPAINAIVHKQYDRARSAVAAGLPDGPLKGVPFSSRTWPSSRRASRPPRQQPVHRLRRRPRQRLRAPLQGRRPRHHGPQLDPRVRPEPEHGAAPLRLVPQSLESRALGWRVLGRCRGGGHRRHPADGARDRRRRLDPHPGGPVRPLRAQAVARPHLHGAGCGRGLGRPLRRPRGEPQRARLGPHARRDRRPRARRPLRRADARALLRRGDRPSAQASSGSP